MDHQDGRAWSLWIKGGEKLLYMGGEVGGGGVGRGRHGVTSFWYIWYAAEQVR